MSATLPVMITCERGLGKLTAAACGRRWAIAHDRAPAEKGAFAAVRNSPCRTCTFGEARMTGASLETAKKTTAPWRSAVLPKIDCKSCHRPFDRSQPAQKICERCKTEDKPKNRAERRALAREHAATVELAYEPEPAQVLPPAEFEVLEGQASAPSTKPCQRSGCDQRFAAERNRRFCSDACMREDTRIRKNDMRAQARDGIPLEQQERSCKGCERAFKPATGNERYCADCKDKVPLQNRSKAARAKEEQMADEGATLAIGEASSEPAEEQDPMEVEFKYGDAGSKDGFAVVPADLDTAGLDQLYAAVHRRVNADGSEILHTFMLRKEWQMVLALPNDISTREVARLTRWLESLPLEGVG